MTPVLTYLNAFPGIPYPQHLSGQTSTQSYMIPGAAIRTKTVTVLQSYNAFPGIPFPQHLSKADTNPYNTHEGITQSFILAGGVQPNTATVSTTLNDAAMGHYAVAETPLGNREVYMVFNSTFKPTMAALPTKKTSKTVGTFVALATALIQKTVNIYRLFLVTTQSFASAVKSSGGHSYSTVATILIGASQGIKQTNKYITAPVVVYSGINPAFNPVSNTTYIPASTVNANNFSTIASGSTIVVMAYTGSTGAATTGVSDGINTYLQANATAGTAGLYGVGLYYCLNATSVPIGTVFTATSSSGSAYTAGIQVLQANTRLDQSNSAVYIASPANIQVNATPLGIFEAAVGAFYSNTGVAGVTGGINNLHPFPGNLPNFFMTYQTDAGNLQTFAPTVNQFPNANGCAAIATFFMPDTSSQKQVNKYMLAGVTAAITSALRQANKYFLNAVTTTFGLLPAFVNVSSVNAYEGAANNTQAIPAGSTIVVMGYTGSNGAATTGVSDGINTYLQANASAATTNIPGAGLYYCTNALAVPINTVFTATASSGSGYVGPIQQLPPGSILDQTNNAINTGGVGASNPFNISSGTLLSSTEISIAAFATVQSSGIQASGKSNNYITFGSSTFNECYISYNNIGSTAAITSGIASGVFPPNGGAALATFIMPIGAIKQVNKIVGVAKTTLQAFFAYLKSGYSQAVYAAVLAQAYLVKQTNKYMTGAINVIANIQKQVNKYMTGPINVIANIKKQVNKSALVSKATATAYLLKQTNKYTNSVVIMTVSLLQKQTEKYILAVVTTGSKIQKQVNKYITAPVIDVALLGQRAIKRTILFGVIMTNQTTKAITIGFRLTVVTVQAFAAAVKQSGGHLYSGLVTVLIGAGQGINGYPYLGFFFGEFSGGGVSIQKQTNKYMTGPVTVMALLGQRSIQRTIQFGVSAVDLISKQINKLALKSTVTMSAFIQKQTNKYMLGLVTTVTKIQKQTNKYMTGAINVIANIQKQTNKYMTGPVIDVALLGQRAINRTILFGISAVDLISKQINKLALKSTVTMSAFIQKQTNKYMLGLVTTVTSLIKQVNKYMTGPINVIANIQKQVNKYILEIVTVQAFRQNQPIKSFTTKVNTATFIQKQVNKYMLGLVTTATLLGQRSLYLFRLCIVTTGTLIQKTVNIYRLFLVTTQSFASAVKSSGGHSYSTVATILIGGGGGVSIQKQVNKYITAPVIDVALLGQRAINRTILFGVTAVDLISKQINKAVLKAVVTVTAQTQHISQLVRTFPSTVTMAAKIQKTVDKNIQAGVNMIAQIFKKNLALFRLFPVTMSALSQKQINKAVLVVNVLVTVPFTLAQNTFIRGFISTVMMVAKLQQRSIGVYRLFQVIDAVQVTKQLTKTIGIFVMLTVAKIQKTVLKSSLLSGVTTLVFYTRSLSKSLLFVITTVATVVTEKFHAPQIFTGKITLAAVIQKTPLKNFISTVTVACKTGLRSLAKYILLVVQVTETTQKFLTRTAIKVGVSLIGLVVPEKVTIRTFPSTVTMAAKTGVRAIGKIVNAFVTMKALNYLQNITKAFILFGVNASAIALKQINKQPFIAKITNNAFVNVRKPINKLATVTITAPYKIYQVLKNVMAFVSAAANRGNRVISKNITFVIDIALKPVKSISRTIVFNVTSQAKIVYGYIYFISREAIVQIKAYRVVYFIFTHHIRAQFNKITQVIQTGYATANSGIRSVFRQFSKINSNLEE